MDCPQCAVGVDLRHALAVGDIKISSGIECEVDGLAQLRLNRWSAFTGVARVSSPREG
jgi:hypothetical protein